MELFSTIVLASLAGILPAILWLWFWLREDDAHPEPRRIIVLTFMYGVISVPFAFIFQLIFNSVFGVVEAEAVRNLPFLSAFGIIFVWAFIEEYVKYIAAWHGGLKKSVTDEAIDVPIYMISAALGFAAFENILFLVQPLISGNTQEFVATIGLRFVGASLVHIASSALIGLFIGYSLFFMKTVRRRYIAAGFILATILHALFNLFIIKRDQNSFEFAGFLLIWFFVVLVIVLFERIKKIKVNTINNVREKEKENIN